MALASRRSVCCATTVAGSGLSARPVLPRRRAAVAVRAETAPKAIDITEDAWESEVLNSSTPVLVDYWAPWCGPCRMIDPLIDQLAAEYQGKMKCVKINTDEFPDVATRHKIRSIPTLMIFKNGQQQTIMLGALPKNDIKAHVEKYLV